MYRYVKLIDYDYDYYYYKYEKKVIIFPLDPVHCCVLDSINILKNLSLWLEFVTNLMHNFIHSVIILHHDPQHVSNITVLIFRRTTVYLQYLVSSHSACCHTVQSALDWCTVWRHTECDDTRYCKHTNCPPEDEHSDARNMLRIMM
jgi:hypothetical protein